VTLTELPVGLSQVAHTFVTCDIVQDSAGNFFFSESGPSVGNAIRRLSADLKQITTFAGAIDYGSADGTGTAARFSAPCGLAIDAEDNLYVADGGNETIRKITPAGVVSTLAGLAGQFGTADGTGSEARFGQPLKLALGPDGDLYVADTELARIRRVTLAGVVTTYAGGTAAKIESGYVDGAPDAARFAGPQGLAITANGDVYVADTINQRIRRIVRSGTDAASVETFAGNGVIPPPQANVDDVGTAAGIRAPSALALLGTALFTCDAAGLVRRIDLTSQAVTTFVGSRANGEGFADGTGPTARIDQCSGLTAAADGSLFAVVHPGAVRRISAAGAVTTIISNPQTDSVGARTGEDGVTRAYESFQLPAAAAIDSAGNAYVTDASVGTVRRIIPSGQVSLVAGLAGGYEGSLDGLGSEAQFTRTLNAIAVDDAGNQYVADQWAVREIASNGQVTTLAGSFTDFGAVDGAGATARFQVITGLAADASGNVFVSDRFNHAIRRIDSAGNVTTYAGALSQPGFVDGPRASAKLKWPMGLALGPGDALYVADGGNCAIRKIASDGTVSTIMAGDCAATSPLNLAVASDGSVFFTDPVAETVSEVLPNGTVMTVIPKSPDGLTHLGANASISQPTAIAISGPKELLITTHLTLVLKATLP
jgi:sugar lactone lactonase YvrE